MGKLLGILAALFIVGLVISPGFAATKKVLFYEVQAPTTLRITASGYTSFNGLLKGAGYSTASITSSDVKLTQEKLADYDVVIMQGLNKALDTEEILALRWYVGVQGGGLMINGAEPDGVNNLGQIYGILMDKQNTWLVDTANFPFDANSTKTASIAAADRKYYALIKNFPDKTDAQGIRMSDVGQIAVYKTHPLFVESVRVNSPIGKTKVIATSSNLSYTETGTFSVGSEPPVAARAFFGNGAVVVISDFNILADANIFDKDFFNETIDNDKFGLAIVNWLSNKDNREISVQGESELAVKVLELQRENLALDDSNRTLTATVQSLRANLTNTTGTYELLLAGTRDTMQKAVTKCETNLGACNTEGYRKMAIGGGIGAVVALLAVGYFFLSAKFKKPKAPAGKGKPEEKADRKGGLEGGKDTARKEEPKKPSGRQESLDEVPDEVS